MKSLRGSLLACACVGLLAQPAIAQAPPTVWHALGIPQTWRYMRDTTANRRGNRPNMERRPPVKRLADPENLKSDVPAIKAAADIKAQQDLAPQKIKAIKYLATIGCGCYGGVAEALAAALEDCTEAVRYEAAKALMQAINCRCEVCQKTCCTPELAAKMYERAYGRDEEGCYLESSDRVRELLAQVLMSCPPRPEDIGQVPDPIPQTDPLPTPLPQPQPDAAPGTTPMPSLNLQPTPTIDALGGSQPVKFQSASASLNQPTTSSRRTAQPVNPPVAAPAALVLPPGGAAMPLAAVPQQPQLQPGTSAKRALPPVNLVPKTLCGEVVDSKTARGYARIMFSEDFRPPVGTELQVYHQYVLGQEHEGSLVIVDYEGALAVAGPRPWQQTKVSRGDTVECTIQIPELAPPPALPDFTAANLPAAQPTPAKAADQTRVAAPARPAEHPVAESFARSVQKAAEQPSTQSPATHSVARGPSPVFVAPGKVAPPGPAAEGASGIKISPAVASAVGIPPTVGDPLTPAARPTPESVRNTAQPVNFRHAAPAPASPKAAAKTAEWLAPIVAGSQLDRHVEPAAITSQVEQQFAPIISAAEAARLRK